MIPSSNQPQQNSFGGGKQIMVQNRVDCLGKDDLRDYRTIEERKHEAMSACERGRRRPRFNKKIND